MNSAPGSENNFGDAAKLLLDANESHCLFLT